jgi:diketogulonate reductase-like aldo/keto reductase
VIHRKVTEVNGKFKSSIDPKPDRRFDTREAAEAFEQQRREREQFEFQTMWSYLTETRKTLEGRIERGEQLTPPLERQANDVIVWATEQGMANHVATIRDLLARSPRPPAQTFGSDVPKDMPEPDQPAVFKGALAAGYRTFDTAESYGTLPALTAAIKASDVDPSELTIVSKIKPTISVEDVIARLKAQLADVPLTAQKVLMLHELAGSVAATKPYLAALADADIPGGVSGIGLSNVTIAELTELHVFALQRKLSLKCVQNRFSPYNQDREVRTYCAENGITYMGFGLFGGQSLGECVEGYAMPAHHLQALQDPRLHDLGRELGVKPDALLLAWAARRGVDVVIYSGSHAKDNVAALDLRLSDELLDRVDALFTVTQAARERAVHDQRVERLYQALPGDATFWFLVDTLMADPAVAKLMVTVIGEIQTRHRSPVGNEYTVAKALENFAYKLLRFVTHLQIAKDLKRGAPPTWTKDLVDSFRTAGAAGSAAGLYRWSQGEYLEVGGAKGAQQHLIEAATTEQPVVGAEDVTGGKLAIQLMTDEVEDLVVGETYRTYTGTVRVLEKIADDSFTVVFS